VVFPSDRRRGDPAGLTYRKTLVINIGRGSRASARDDRRHAEANDEA
jgi:hypothetical protein